MERARDSVFTVEVHSGSSDARDVLGSGYLVSDTGLVVTNYHVVGSYIDDPKRYQLRVRNGQGVHAARLLRFDLINDLALLEIAPIAVRPLTLAQRDPERGSSIVSLGNPEGLGLSLIEGVFNGYAEKGFVDRQLLSMPLNSGMSGGPIMNRAGEVIGTNVSVIWRANSLSFGVPVAKVKALLAAPSVSTDAASLRADVSRQLAALEHETRARVVEKLSHGDAVATVAVGELSLRRPPALFDCWNTSHVYEDEGVTKRHYGCNLQFTPRVEKIGEVGSVELGIEELTSRGNAYGFYGALGTQAEHSHRIKAQEPNNGILSAPHCEVERIRTRYMAFKVNTCLSAYVKHPGLFNGELIATTVSRPRHGAVLTLRASGITLDSFLALTRGVLGDVRWGDGQ